MNDIIIMVSKPTHIEIKTKANKRFSFSIIGLLLAFFLDSSKISGGISFIEREIKAGIIKRSSRYPNTGIKSGIRSMGLKV